MLAQIQDTGLPFPALAIMALLLIATVTVAVRIIGRMVRWMAHVHRAIRSRLRRGRLTHPVHVPPAACRHGSHGFVASALFLIICGGLTRASILSSPQESVSSPQTPNASAADGQQPGAELARAAVSSTGSESDAGGIHATVTSATLATSAAPAPESAGSALQTHATPPHGDLLLLLQVPPDVISAVPGEAGSVPLTQLMPLTELQARLSRRIGQVYALIPLTAPGNPVTAGGSPLAAAEQLGVLTQAFRLLLRSAARPEDPVSTGEGAPPTAAVPAELPASAGRPVPAELPESSDITPPSAAVSLAAATPLPGWVTEPDGDRIVVEAYAPFEDDSQESLNAAVGEALTQHLSDQLQGRIRPQASWGRLVRLQLSPETFQECVLAQHQLVTDIPMPGGPQKWRKTYALVQFSEAVDRAAEQEIRQAVQQHRMAAVILLTGIFWLMLFSAGLLLRAGRGRNGLLRLCVAAGLLLVSLPLGLFGATMTLAVCRGDALDLPWEHGGRAVTITTNL